MKNDDKISRERKIAIELHEDDYVTLLRAFGGFDENDVEKTEDAFASYALDQVTSEMDLITEALDCDRGIDPLIISNAVWHVKRRAAAAKVLLDYVIEGRQTLREKKPAERCRPGEICSECYPESGARQ